MVGDSARSRALLVEHVSVDTLSAIRLLEGVGDAVDWVGESGIVYQIQNALTQLVLRRVRADIVGTENGISPLHRLTDGADTADNPGGVPVRDWKRPKGGLHCAITNDDRLDGQGSWLIIVEIDVMVRVTAEHVLLPMWSEKVPVVGGSEGVPDRNQPLEAEFPHFLWGIGIVTRQHPREGSTGTSYIRNVKFNRRALKNGAVKEMTLLVRGRVDMTKDVCGPGRFTKEGNIRGVTTKLGDEIMNPLEEHLLIAEAWIERVSGAVRRERVGKAHHNCRPPCPQRIRYPPAVRG